MDRIMEIADKHGIAVIEDNAQCFLSTYKGRLAGTIGHVSSWSFENSKHMSCGEGGMKTMLNLLERWLDTDIRILEHPMGKLN